VDTTGTPARIQSKIRHLYVHVPFCHRVCPYCGFHKHTPGGHDIPAFFRAVVEEARRARDRFDLDLQTVYFGGGTPTLPSRSVLVRFLEAFADVLDMSRIEEFTFEANPRTFDREKIDALLDAGVTRISLGVQSWDDATLAVLGRDHSPAEAVEACAILRAAGVPVVSLDLMFSVPGQSLENWRATLEKTVEQNPDHISAYNLNYEEDTEFFERFERGEFAGDPANDAAFFLTAVEVLGAAGFEAYEVSNYARPGCESLHNSAYWQGADYVGLGPAAFSTVAGRRWKNVADTALYTALAGLGPRAIECEVEHLTPEQLRTERIALQLRTRHGLALETLGADAPERMDSLVREGLAHVAGERLVLTPRGRLVADSVAVHLL
jgi:oxygen-independent coproporphyrinogen-3 oxidase